MTVTMGKAPTRSNSPPHRLSIALRRHSGHLMSRPRRPVAWRRLATQRLRYIIQHYLQDSIGCMQLSTTTTPLQFPDLASFLVARACRSTELASYFYWYLSVECNDHKDNLASIKYEKIRFKFLEDLKNVCHIHQTACHVACHMTTDNCHMIYACFY